MTNEPKPSFFRSFTGTLAAIAIGVIGASVVALPAAYLAPLVASAADGKVSLTNATGRVWEGRGDLTIALAGPPIALRGLQWTVRPLRLFAGEQIGRAHV